MAYNKVLSVHDYAATGITSRKQWEVQQALRALEDHCNLTRKSTVLIPGAGHEPTIYHLSRKAGKVIALDLYEDAGMWSANAPSDMLTDPSKYAPAGADYNLSRIEVVHGDMRDLSAYANDSIDAICSLGSIEHVGTYEDVARAAAEIGRVLKSGGVAAIATEYRISGDGVGWDGVLLFDSDELNRVIVQASGLELIDELQTDVDAETLATAYPLRKIVETGQRPNPEAALTNHGYTFTSVMLALRKPDPLKPVKRSRKKSATKEKNDSSEADATQ